jgi:hypothetical protein
VKNGKKLSGSKLHFYYVEGTITYRIRYNGRLSTSRWKKWKWDFESTGVKRRCDDKFYGTQLSFYPLPNKWAQIFNQSTEDFRLLLHKDNKKEK